MKFKSLNIVKHPREIVWNTMRDQFPKIVELVEEVDSIDVISRKELPEGYLEIINVWKANPPIPDMLAKHLQPEMLAWTDTAIWDKNLMVCNWVIDSHYFKEKMNCKGFTKFEPAIGGRGCRLTFQGTIDWDGDLPINFGVVDGMVTKALESIISKVIPNNFRKLTTGVAIFIEKQNT